MTLATKPRQVFRPDPLLGWGLTPGARVQALFRRDREVVQSIDDEGWRRVPGAAGPAGPAGPGLALYGCSFTFGTGLADDETFAARLQAALPGMPVMNRGVGGYGTVQGYLQFRRELRAGRVRAAIVGLISDHRFRNVPHPHKLRQHRVAAWAELGVEHIPMVRMRRRGGIEIDWVANWQPALEREDFDVFLPDDAMLDAATFALLDAILALGRAHAVPVAIAVLDSIDPEFNALVCERYPQAVDVSTPYDLAHTFLPDNIHPNVAANALFAERLEPVAKRLCSGPDGAIS